MVAINIQKLNYTFVQKPLLTSGITMEYYGLRKAGGNVDFVVTKEDYNQLHKRTITS
jgi:hypothetical protein